LIDNQSKNQLTRKSLSGVSYIRKWIMHVSFYDWRRRVLMVYS